MTRTARRTPDDTTSAGDPTGAAVTTGAGSDATADSQDTKGSPDSSVGGEHAHASPRRCAISCTAVGCGTQSGRVGAFVRGTARLRIGAIAIACCLSASCHKDGAPDDTVAETATAGDVTGAANTAGQGSDAATDSPDDTAGVSESSTGGELGDPAVIAAACTGACELELGCVPRPPPRPNFDSVEECVAGCVGRQEQYYRDGCGPETLAELVCYSGLTCEQWLEVIDGNNICGGGGPSFCPD